MFHKPAHKDTQNPAGQVPGDTNFADAFDRTEVVGWFNGIPVLKLSQPAVSPTLGDTHANRVAGIGAELQTSLRWAVAASNLDPSRTDTDVYHLARESLDAPSVIPCGYMASNQYARLGFAVVTYRW